MKSLLERSALVETIRSAARAVPPLEAPGSEEQPAGAAKGPPGPGEAGEDETAAPTDDYATEWQL